MAAREDDKAMAGLLRRSLAQDAGAGSGPGDCPEPEILAAYFDHALDAEETARYDLHFSRCSVCREQLAAMARAGGVGVAAAAGKKIEGAWAWLTGPRWLMPAAAMLVALLAITGIALRMRKPVAPTNEIAMARPDALPQANSAPVTTPEPPTNSAPSPEAALSSRAASYAPRAMDKIAASPSTPSPSHADAAGAPVAPSESTPSRELGAGLPPRTVAHANTAGRAGAFSGVGGAAGAKSAAAPVRQSLAQKPASQASPGMVRGAMQARNGVGAASGSGAGVAGGTVNSADETATVMEAAPPADVAEPSKMLSEKKTEAYSGQSDAQLSVETETAPQPNARKAKSAATTSGAAAPTQSAKAMNLAASQTMEAAALAKMQQAQISSNLMNLQIQTPDPKILWMITGADAIEKSQDGGATWKLEYLETHTRIIAGSAPSVKICWLVGEGGTILRTTNGAHWKTIRPPEETAFVRVEATDALTATVTALDGRRFSTSDGGKSWNSVK
jgi:hypothetical protein